MMRIVRRSALVVATLAVLVSAGGCESGNGRNGGDSGADGAGGLPPGARCVVNFDAGIDAGVMVPTYCLENPVLPTCFQCVDPSADGNYDDAICVYTCRMGEKDCPSGQACTVAGSSSRTKFQECRNLTGGYTLGYCQ